MKQLRTCIDKIRGLRYVIEQMEFCSSVGRTAMLDSEWSSSCEEINARFDLVELYRVYLTDPKYRNGVEEVRLHLSELMNVAGSIEFLFNPNISCSDVDLFEIKRLSLIEDKVRLTSEREGLQLIDRPSLREVVSILDPDNERLSSFFISDSYSGVLKTLRIQMQRAQTEVERDGIAVQCAEEEDRVRRRLTILLRPYAENLRIGLAALAEIDRLFAIARWSLEVHACRPTLSSERGEYYLEDLVHPEVRQFVEDHGGTYQPVSISYSYHPTIITGANMAGKSVLLSSIALAQCLAQYGCFVTARGAHLNPVDEVMLLMGDDQNIESGISSFGAEILRLNSLIQMVRFGRSVFALIDEPARTTNPEEGRAIVSSLVQLLDRLKVSVIITTHYSNIKGNCSRWRVKGFIEEKLRYPLEVNQLNHCIDYSLLPDSYTAAPQEALRIAEILGLDGELIDLCKKNLATKDEEK